MDIGHGFFMAKFDMEGDRLKVMEEGPWMVFDHYLTVQTWTPEFMSPTAKIDKTMVWIRFPGLNLLYYDESILLALAAAVGKPIKVDTNTLDVRRGRFARVCVEIDLTKPVVGKVWMRKFWYKVEYEGLHRICTNCGCYGHMTSDCTTEITVEVRKVTQPPVEEDQDADKAANLVTDSPTSPQNNDAAVIDTTNNGNNIQEVGPLHGDWIIVKKKKGKNRAPNQLNNGRDLKGFSSMGNHGIRDKNIMGGSQQVNL